MNDLYVKFDSLPNDAAQKEFILTLPAEKRYTFLVYLMNKKNLLLSEIMDALGIRRLE